MGPKIEFETAVVSEPSVFEPLKFYCIYKIKITINNGTPHLKSLKKQNRKATLGRPAIKLLRTSTSFAVDQPSPLVLPWFLRHLVDRFASKIPSS